MGKMKIKSKGAWLICAVAIILIIVMLVVKGGDKAPDNSGTQNKLTEEFVTINENGEKENTSTQLKKTKTVAGLELTNIRLKEVGGITRLLADATNTTNSTIEELNIIVTAVDKNGNTLAEFEASVYSLSPGATTTLNAGITADVANAYDFTVRLK